MFLINRQLPAGIKAVMIFRISQFSEKRGVMLACNGSWLNFQMQSHVGAAYQVAACPEVRCAASGELELMRGARGWEGAAGRVYSK